MLNIFAAAGQSKFRILSPRGPQPRTGQELVDPVKAPAVHKDRPIADSTDQQGRSGTRSGTTTFILNDRSSDGRMWVANEMTVKSCRDKLIEKVSEPREVSGNNAAERRPTLHHCSKELWTVVMLNSLLKAVVGKSHQGTADFAVFDQKKRAFQSRLIILPRCEGTYNYSLQERHCRSSVLQRQMIDPHAQSVVSPSRNHPCWAGAMASFRHWFRCPPPRQWAGVELAQLLVPALVETL